MCKLKRTAAFQDEVEFGYIDSPHHRFPVVLDSPRDGALLDFPYDKLLVRESNVYRNIYSHFAR